MERDKWIMNMYLCIYIYSDVERAATRETVTEAASAAKASAKFVYFVQRGSNFIGKLSTVLWQVKLDSVAFTGTSDGGKRTLKSCGKCGKTICTAGRAFHFHINICWTERNCATQIKNKCKFKVNFTVELKWFEWRIFFLAPENETPIRRSYFTEEC